MNGSQMLVFQPRPSQYLLARLDGPDKEAASSLDKVMVRWFFFFTRVVLLSWV
jgi:hypothetical protein